MCLLSGGSFIGRPVLCMPFAAFYLACAVYPTLLHSLLFAGSRSAAQTMVRKLQLIQYSQYMFVYFDWQTKKKLGLYLSINL